AVSCRSDVLRSAPLRRRSARPRHVRPIGAMIASTKTELTPVIPIEVSRMWRFGFIFMMALWAALPGAAAAAPAGTAVGVDPMASDVAKTTRTLVVGADIAMGDRVVTGSTGQVQIVFTDQTHLVVGPGSSLVIASYLLRGGGSARRFAIDALGGTFRFVTGQSDHSAYTISTPAAELCPSIGVSSARSTRTPSG